MTSNIANQYLGLLKAGSDQQKYKHSNKEGGVFEELLGKEMDVTYKKATCPETQLDRKEEGSFTYFENDIRKERKIDIELNNGVRLNIESISEEHMQVFTQTVGVESFLEKQKAITKAFNEKSNKMLGESLQFLFGILDRVEESGLSINDKRKDKKRQVELDQTGKEASDNDKKPEKGILDEKTTEQLSVEKETDIKGSEKKESGKNGKMFQEMLKKRVMKDIMEKMFD